MEVGGRGGHGGKVYLSRTSLKDQFPNPIVLMDGIPGRSCRVVSCRNGYRYENSS